MPAGDGCPIWAFDPDSLRTAGMYITVRADDDVAALAAGDFVAAGAGD
jgi:hypothetical protein